MKSPAILALVAVLAGCSVSQPQQASPGSYIVQFRYVSASKEVIAHGKICGSTDTLELESNTITFKCLLGDYGIPSVMLTTSKWKESRTEPLPKYKGQSVYGQFPLFTNGDNVDKLYYEVTAN